jgi:hypothetical protein
MAKTEQNEQEDLSMNRWKQPGPKLIADALIDTATG